MDELHDWSSYLIQVEQHLRQLNHKLLHNRYAGIEEHVQTIKDRLDKMVAWVEEHREQ